MTKSKDLLDLNHGGIFRAIAECTWWREGTRPGEPGRWWTTRVEVDPDESIQHLFKRMFELCEGWGQDDAITIRFVSRYEFVGDYGERRRPGEDGGQHGD